MDNTSSGKVNSFFDRLCYGIGILKLSETGYIEEFSTVFRKRPDIAIEMNEELRLEIQRKLINDATAYSDIERKISFTYAEVGGYAAIAITSDKDNFSRKLGRRIVEGRIKDAIKHGKLPKYVVAL